MLCKGCDEDKRLVNSHIIPRAYYEVTRGDRSVPFNVVTNSDGKVTPFSMKGIYDNAILCAECEELFNKTDGYAATILLQKEGKQQPIFHGQSLTAFYAENVDVDRIKYFFMSVLWRASISTQQFFSDIDLGTTEDRLRILLRDKSTGSVPDYEFVLGKYTPSKCHPDLHRLILNPKLVRVSGIRFYRFYLGGYVLMIKSSREKMPQALRKTTNAQGLIIANLGPYEESREYEVVQKLLNDNLAAGK